MNFFDQMPLDPFKDDPNDPASFLDPDEPMEPLTAEEKQQVKEELHQIREFERTLSPVGIRGICMMCEDCEDLHYYDWGILKDNLISLLHNELAPIHEPGASPDPNQYAPWEYCLGYMDGLNRGLMGFH